MPHLHENRVNFTRNFFHSVKSWCFEVFNFALTHCESDLPDKTSGQPLSPRDLILGADYVPLVTAVSRWKLSGQFDQLLYCNLRYIVVQHVLDRIFLPFHPSLYRSSSRPSSNANIGQDHLSNELINNVADRIQRTSVYAQ